MTPIHHKAVRREILDLLYHIYLDDPLRMVEPEVFFHSPIIDRASIIPNMHYLADRRLVEMMMGYQPPMFTAVRITHQGVDLVESRFEFNRQFPAAPSETLHGEEAIPMLVERLVVEADLVPLERDIRHQILGDILYLREEFNRPLQRWRPQLIFAVITAVESIAGKEAPPTLARLREAVMDTLGTCEA